MKNSEQGEIRKKRIIQLRRQGLLYKEIAKKLNIPAHRVGYICAKLIREGRIKKRKRGTKPEWIKKADEIASMVKKRKTLQEIGDNLGVTRERARQIISKIKQEMGAEIFEPEPGKKLYLISETAEKLGCDPQAIARVLNTGDIDLIKRKKRRGRLVTAKGIAQLKKHSALAGITKTCPVCKKDFVTKRYKGSFALRYCSKKCRAVAVKEMRKEHLARSPDEHEFTKWRALLWEKIKNNTIPKDDQWVTLSRAKEISGLTQMQVIWLRKNKVFTMRPHPTRRWRGRPIFLYSTSQLKLARHAVAEYEKKNKSD